MPTMKRAADLRPGDRIPAAPRMIVSTTHTEDTITAELDDGTQITWLREGNPVVEVA